MIKSRPGLHLEETSCGDIWLHVTNKKNECQASVNLGSMHKEKPNSIISKAFRTFIKRTKL